MKARRVKGLNPEGLLADNLERIIRVRLDEVHGFVPLALDPVEVEALHDMRIAAKRLRYLLELGGHLFGPYAKPGAKRAKDLQDLLGEVHDCDVLEPRIEALLAERQARAARSVRERAAGADDVDPALAADLPGADEWRGLHALTAHLQGRRALLFDRFGELWPELEREGFRPRLEYALAERAAATGQADGDGAVANGEPPQREGTATLAATLDSA